MFKNKQLDRIEKKLDQLHEELYRITNGMRDSLFTIKEGIATRPVSPAKKRGTKKKVTTKKK